MKDSEVEQLLTSINTASTRGEVLCIYDDLRYEYAIGGEVPIPLFYTIMERLNALQDRDIALCSVCGDYISRHSVETNACQKCGWMVYLG